MVNRPKRLHFFYLYLITYCYKTYSGGIFLNEYEIKDQLHHIMTRNILSKKSKKADYLNGGSLLIALGLLQEKDRYNLVKIIEIYSKYRTEETNRVLRKLK